MSKLGWVSRIGGFAAAPFTGGWSIPAGMAAGSALDHVGNNDNKSNDPQHPEDPVKDLLSKQAAKLQGTGTQMTDAGMGAVGQVLQYLRSLQNGGTELLQATQADRGRVMDQYDTARKAIATFGPRGGGQTQALAESRISEANQLSDVTSNALQEGRKLSAQLGPTLASLGLDAERLASSDLDTVLRAILAREGLDVEKRGQTMAMWGGIGQAAGTILGDILLGGDS